MSETDSKHVIVYSDGACIGNPGPGGYGVVLQYGQHQKELFDGYRLTTNNRMELMGAIAGLEALKTRCNVTLYTDSQLLVNGLIKGWVEKWRKKGWKRGKKWVLNADLWQRLVELMEQHEVEVIWVKGHAGNPGNERADALSMQAAQYKCSNIDAAYEEGETQLKPISLFSFRTSGRVKKTTTVELDGKKYIWDESGWVDENYITPPQIIIRRLNQELAGKLEQEDRGITDVYVLAERARQARENKQYDRAELLARKILEIDPENHSGLAVLSASLREKGFPRRALAETDRYQTTSNPALLTSRAAAYCDLEMWEEAKRTIGQALAIQKSDEALLVVQRIKKARPDLY